MGDSYSATVATHVNKILSREYYTSDADSVSSDRVVLGDLDVHLHLLHDKVYS